MMKTKTYDLEERLILFSVSILHLVEKMPKDFVSIYLGKQLVRSSTSPALNYGEAQVAESRRDFVHKLRICLKELRESKICLQIIDRKINFNKEDCQQLIKKCIELIAIISTSIKTTIKISRQKQK